MNDLAGFIASAYDHPSRVAWTSSPTTREALLKQGFTDVRNSPSAWGKTEWCLRAPSK